MKRALLVALACTGCYDFGALATQSSLCGRFSGVTCDGYEDQLPAPPGWLDIHGSTSGSVNVDSSRAYRGSYSFHIHADATNGTAAALVDVGGRNISQRPIFDTAAAMQLSNRAYLRMFLYLPSLTGGRLTLLEIGRRMTANVGYNGFGASIDVGGGWSMFQTMAATSPPGPPAAIGRWVCVELGLDNSAGTADLFLDGAVTPSLSLAGTPVRKDPLDPQSLNIDFLAFEYYNPKSSLAMPAFDAWIDEVAVDSTRVGCTR
jgi:hypothetical protein